MCLNCMIEVSPDRGSVCMEDGAFMVNFKGCQSCGVRDILEKANEEVETEDEEAIVDENTTFTHICKHCQHKVAEHYFHFETDGNTQQYLMECFLCGKGTETVFLKGNRPDERLSALNDQEEAKLQGPNVLEVASLSVKPIVVQDQDQDNHQGSDSEGGDWE